MIIDLRRCAESAVHVERVFDVSEFPGLNAEIAKLDPVRLVLDVAMAGARRFIATGSFESEVSATCVRCVEPVTAPLAGSFRVIYLPDSGAVNSAPGESVLDSASVDVSYYNDAEGIRNGLVEQLVKPLRWQKCMEKLLDEGVENFYEIGPGRVLTGLMRRINRKTRVNNVSDLKSLNALIGA